MTCVKASGLDAISVALNVFIVAGNRWDPARDGPTTRDIGTYEVLLHGAAEGSAGSNQGRATPYAELDCAWLECPTRTMRALYRLVA